MDIKHYDIIVVGAGFAGTTIANRMAALNKRVLVIEKRNHIAGNMYEEYDQARILIHKYGPHIFHTNNEKVFNFLQQFGEWFPYEHRVLGRIDGQLVPIPFNFKSIDMLFSKEQATKLKLGLQKQFPNQEKISVLALKEANDSLISNFGEYVFQKVFVNYTAKQWGIPIDQVDTSTINRVPVALSYDDRYFQDKYQFMPKDGFTQLFHKMLNHPLIEVLLMTNIQPLLRFENDAFSIDNQLCQIPLIFTGAVDEILNYRFGPLPYRSLTMVFENYNLSQYQPGCVINYPNEEKFTRITEFKYLTQQRACSTTILKEFPEKYDHLKGNTPYYPINNPTNDALFKQYAAFLNKYPNFYLCGRLAEYKYYNMDGVIEQALNLVDKINNKKAL